MDQTDASKSDLPTRESNSPTLGWIATQVDKPMSESKSLAQKDNLIFDIDRSLNNSPTGGGGISSTIGLDDISAINEQDSSWGLNLPKVAINLHQTSSFAPGITPKPGLPKRVQFKSLLASNDTSLKATSNFEADVSDTELASFYTGLPMTGFTSFSSDFNDCDMSLNNERSGCCDSDDEDSITYHGDDHGFKSGTSEGVTLSSSRCDSPIKRHRYFFSFFRTSNLPLVSRLFNHRPAYHILNHQDPNESTSQSTHVECKRRDLSRGTTNKRSKTLINQKLKALAAGRRTFRGSYKYSKSDLSMTIFKRILYFIFQRSTLALFGAFLIHVTLGTVYTLSNVNSYLTSYLRMHGFPNTTYAWSVWISSTYAIGQGFSMVLGGYLEKKFSAQLACTLGCAIHSLSTMSTSKSIDYGPMAVLLTYGFLPGFGCGLAYMTPMSNGFGWYPDRKGLVAGVILAGFGIGTFVFNMAQTAYVNPDNMSPTENSLGYFTQETVIKKVPDLFIFMGSLYATMQLVGCCLLFKPPTHSSADKPVLDRMTLIEPDISLSQAVRKREFMVLFIVYGVTTQGVLFVNSMLKEYGQIFIGSDMYLAWVGSMASIANSTGRLFWGLAIDRYSFTQCFTAITIIFGAILFIMPFEFVLSSKLFYLIGTLGLFGSFSGWMSTYPVHLSRVFGRTNSGMVYGLIYTSQSACGVFSAMMTHYLIDHFNRFIPFFCMAFLQVVGLVLYHTFYPK